MTDYHKDRISIQVGLSGYSFKVEADGAVRSSEWMSADRIFTSPEFQKRYDEVEVSVFTPKCALVPKQFHRPGSARQLLEEIADIAETDSVDYVDVPQFASVLVYSNTIGESLSRVISEMVLKTDGNVSHPLPELYFMLSHLSEIQEYNKILASYKDGYLYLVVAQGRTLLLCNAYQAQDFTTAEYFIFLVMKKLQLNIEMSTIYFRTSLAEDEEISLYRYFKNVEQI
jgi:hypothetical protein